MDVADEKKTYVLYAPPRDWGSQWAGMNFKSKEAVRTRRSPRNALKEWIALADAITHASGEVIVMPEPNEDERNGEYIASLTNMANAGEFFIKNDKPAFLISRMNPKEAPLRQKEWRFVQWFIKNHLDIPAQRSDYIWEGQADLLHIAPGKVIATYGRTPGVRSSWESLREIRRYLPRKTQVLGVELKYPFFHGDTALAYYESPQKDGKGVFLYCPEAIIFPRGRKLLEFVDPFINGRLILTKEEGMVYTANTLQVNETLIMNRDVPPEISNILVKCGFRITELDLTELFGKGGGGPRCLTNILRTPNRLMCNPNILYTNCRDAIVSLLPTYPA